MGNTIAIGKRTGAWPLIDPYRADALAFQTPEGPLSQAGLLARAAALAERLPARSHAVNYCERRDLFSVALLAIWMRGQTALFPADRAEHTYRNLAAEHPDVYTISDDAMPFDTPGNVDCSAASFAGRNAPRVTNDVPDASWSHLAVRVYTSGSTGKPSVNEKTWGMLVAGGKSIPQMLALDARDAGTVVATVPSQHMYGFETSVMNVLQGGFAAHAERPVYPADIARCLDEAPEPRILVTTPVHLRALVEGGSALPAIAKIISATAPLSSDLAAAAEARLKAPVWEIYGFTEAGSVAGRHTVASGEWTLRSDFAARSDGVGQFVAWDDFDRRIPFPDVVEIIDPGHIRLQGRSQDVVNVAGKRASLSGLSANLVAIDGVADGVFWLPAEDTGMGVVSRLVAFVVAPDADEASIRAALQKKIDPVFMPRSIFHVDALPRNATGKLTQNSMKQLAADRLKGHAKS
jgi:acyl-coenzyme A synthetase/AMP-(fatty) acid ligase